MNDTNTSSDPPVHGYDAPIDAKHHAVQLGLGAEYHVRRVDNEIVYLPGESTEELQAVVNSAREVMEDVPVLPDNLRRITEAWLLRWVQWVAAGRPDVTPVDERELVGDATAATERRDPRENDWNPVLHPRDPDTGQFVERSFAIPDDTQSFTDESIKTQVAFLDQQGADIDEVLSRNSSVTIDGVPKDAETAAEIPDDPDRANPNEPPPEALSGSALSDAARAIENDASKDRDQSVREIETLVKDSTEMKVRFDEFDQAQAAAVADAVGRVQEEDGRLPIMLQYFQSRLSDKVQNDATDRTIAGYTNVAGDGPNSASVFGIEFNTQDGVFDSDFIEDSEITVDTDEPLVQVALHEIAHAKHHENSLSSGQGSGFQDGRALPRFQQNDDFVERVSDEVSEYGSQNVKEFIAEMYAKRMTDGELPTDDRELISIYENRFGEEA
jgi:hypothetical protein